MSHLPNAVPQYVEAADGRLLRQRQGLLDPSRFSVAPTSLFALGCAVGRRPAVTGKYEVVADALFEKQDSWVATGRVAEVISGALSPADFAKAKAAFEAHKSDIDAIIGADLKAGTDLKVQETPTTRVSKGSQVITDKQGGMISYTVLKKYLDQQLGK